MNRISIEWSFSNVAERYSRFFSNAVKNFRNPLMVLPFEFLRFTLSESKLTDFYFIYAPVIDFVLMYLAVYTHQPENKNFNINGENCVSISSCFFSIRTSYGEAIYSYEI